MYGADSGGDTFAISATSRATRVRRRKLLVVDDLQSHLELQGRDERAQVGVARALPVAVDAPLDLHGAGADRGQGVGDRAARIIVAVNAGHRAELGGDVADDRLDAIGQRAAVGVAEGRPFGAGLDRRGDAADRVVGVADVSIEEVLRVEHDPPSLVDKPAHRLRDHREVLLARRPQHVGNVPVPRLAHERDDRRHRVEQRAQLQVVLRPRARASRRAERGQRRVAQAMRPHRGEELGVGRVCAGPPALDDGDAERVEMLGDAQLVGHREADANSLRAVAQRRVVDLECHDAEPSGRPTLRTASRVTASAIAAVPAVPPRSAGSTSSAMQTSTAPSMAAARSSRCSE